MPRLSPPVPLRHRATSLAASRVSRSTRRAVLVATAAASAAVAWATAGCSRGESRPVLADSTGPSTPREPRTELAVVPPATGRYAARAVTDGGTIVGTVTIVGDAPPDTTVALDSISQRACRAPTLVDRTVARRGDRLGGVAVFLADVRTGSALPLERRHELHVDGCTLVPRIQAVVAGGTLNVRSSDPLLTRLRFVRQPVGEVLRVVETNDEGQVVPDEKVLAEPGVIEVRGERHPWLRAYVVVVPHPYVTTSDGSGGFSLRDVPPGTYTLVAWHERFGKVEQRVEVRAGGTAEVKVEMGRDDGAGPGEARTVGRARTDAH